MEQLKLLINRYKHLRSKQMLQQRCSKKYAFVGIGSHSTNNLYPVLSYLHVPLKRICCKSADKKPLIESAFPGVIATTSLLNIVSDNEITGVFVCASPQAHFSIASEVIKSGKALFIEKPPCQSQDELMRLIATRKASGLPLVAVGLQKRVAPAIQTLKKELKKNGNSPVTYNMTYLTGAYPEGNALLDLFIHPLDCVTFLFGKAEVKCAESVNGHTLMLILKHKHATGVIELSTAYSWSTATEALTVNASNGTYHMTQMERLTFQSKQQTLMGVPLEKICPRPNVTIDLFARNNFAPIVQNNQIFTQGYFSEIKNFVDALEGRCKKACCQSLESVVDTYSLLEAISTLPH